MIREKNNGQWIPTEDFGCKDIKCHVIKTQRHHRDILQDMWDKRLKTSRDEVPGKLTLKMKLSKEWSRE
jgi:hypothetical protein